MSLDQTPLYNLKTVINETGLAAATLRAWERRYGLPSPSRSSGGQRLYSGRDIEMLRWLAARLAEGARIRQAVDQWRELEAAGRDPLAGQTFAAENLSGDVQPAGLTSLEDLRHRWLDACKGFNEAAAEKILQQAFAVHPLEMVCIHILQAGLRQIGWDWYEGRVSVQQEHFTSALSIRHLEARFSSTPLPTRPETVLVGCPTGEWHTFSPLLMVLLLRRRGLRVFYLGADLPARHLTDAVRQINPDLVILVAQTLTSAANLLPTARILREENRPMAYGGWIFTREPRLLERIPAHYLGDDLEAAVLQADRLASNPPTLPPLPPPTPELSALLEAFRDKRAAVEKSILADKTLKAIDPARLSGINRYIGEDIQAALELGDITLLELDLRWIRSLLNPEIILTNNLDTYLWAYRRALRHHLGSTGRLLSDWPGWEG